MKFFISSTFIDLKDIRQVAINMINSLIGTGTGTIEAMEFFDANEAPSVDVCLNKIHESDLVIGIYGNRYGTIVVDDPGGRSMTEIEFDQAKMLGIPVLSFVANNIETEAEPLQKQFIQNKVFGSPSLSARFDLKDLKNFADRLNGSLKTYFGELDGYEYHSIWDDIRELKEKLTSDDSFPHLVPYEDNEELEALNQIVASTQYLSEAVDDLVAENEIIQPLAYNYDNIYLENIAENEQNTLSQIKQNSNLILRNWEAVNIFIPNHIKGIWFAACYLQLCYVQSKLLKANWTEALRQEILSVKHEYMNFIKTNSMLID